MNIDPEKVYVAVRDPESGEIIQEKWNPNGKQTDGSRWNIPRDIVPEGHEHFFKMKSARDRWIECDCGFGGRIYPHNSKVIDGHIYRLNGIKVI